MTENSSTQSPPPEKPVKKETDYSITHSENGFMVNGVHTGMLKEEVKALFGEPDYQGPDEDDFPNIDEVLRYGKVYYLFYGEYLTNIFIEDNLEGVYTSDWYQQLGQPFTGEKYDIHMYYIPGRESILKFSPMDGKMYIYVTHADNNFYYNYFPDDWDRLEELQEKSRITLNMMGINENYYTVYIYSDQEESWIANFDDGTVWAGANEGDRIYSGTYQIAIQKYGPPFFEISEHQFTMDYNPYHYNNQIYKVEAAGNPDILLLSNVANSNHNLARLYVIDEGKLEPIRFVWEDGSESFEIYVSSFQHDSGNTYIQSTYDNGIGAFQENNWELKPNEKKFIFVKKD